MLKSLTRSLLIVVCLTIPWLACAQTGRATAPLLSAPDLEVFSREGCPRCTAAKIFVTHLQRQRPALRIIVHEIDTDAAALARL